MEENGERPGTPAVGHLSGGIIRLSKMRDLSKVDGVNLITLYSTSQKATLIILQIGSECTRMLGTRPGFPVYIGQVLGNAADSASGSASQSAFPSTADRRSGSRRVRVWQRFATKWAIAFTIPSQ